MQELKRRFKNIARIVFDLCSITYGLIYYLLNHKKPLNERTPSHSHLSMIRLFCLTSGWFNDFISKCISLIDKPISLPDQNGILGNLSQRKVEEICKSLEDDGYFLFENVVPQELIRSLYQFAERQECTLRPLDGSKASEPVKAFYDRVNPAAAVYDIPFPAIVSNTSIQPLFRDHSLLAVAQRYLKTSAKLDYAAFWWSTSYIGLAQSNSAQMFHFDLDRFKWLKIFIFLTEVTLENGPHVFIRKTHRSGTIPRSLLKGGYVRHADEDVYNHYPKDDVKVFTVPAGSILIEDTRGLHKGTNLIRGERLVLELQFTNCLFGGLSASLQNVVIQDEALLAFAKQNPKIFKLYPI